MSVDEALIVVIDDSIERSRNIKELIEFMDAPKVCVLQSDDWRARIEGRRLAAVFIGEALGAETVDQVIREVGELDPNTAIVRISAEGDFRKEAK